jgi:hypothetical protein
MSTGLLGLMTAAAAPLLLLMGTSKVRCNERRESQIASIFAKRIFVLAGKMGRQKLWRKNYLSDLILIAHLPSRPDPQRYFTIETAERISMRPPPEARQPK